MGDLPQGEEYSAETFSARHHLDVIEGSSALVSDAAEEPNVDETIVSRIARKRQVPAPSYATILV